jgi:hypothetical protein
MLFEITGIIALLTIMVAITWTMVRMMDLLERLKMHFVPAAWLTTAWGLVAIGSSSVFVLDVLRLVFGV